MPKRAMAYLVIVLGVVVLVISLAADFGDWRCTRHRLETADGRGCRANRDDLWGLARLVQSEVVVIFNSMV